MCASSVRLFLAAVIALGPIPASAQYVDLNFPVFETESDDQAANCGTGPVMGLKVHGDGLLAVRSGPGTQYRKLDELQNGDQVMLFGKQGDWWVIMLPGGQLDQEDACQRIGGRQRLSGNGLGWVNANWIGDVTP